MEQRTRTRIGLPAIIVVAILIVVGIWFYGTRYRAALIPDTTSYDETTADGTISFSHDSRQFGLAVTPDQVLVKSYIPPCAEGFDYCLYYIDKEYEGTNFESAGLAIVKRSNLATERLCLDTPPEGFSSSTKATASVTTDTHTSSVFEGIGDAAMGHYSSGNLYRLYVRDNSSCYQFESRIGQSQYLNYPEGTIKEFTTEDQDHVQAALNDILRNIVLLPGETGLFPKPRP